MDIKVMAEIVRSLEKYIHLQTRNIGEDNPYNQKADTLRFKPAKDSIVIMRHMTLKQIISGAENLDLSGTQLTKMSQGILNSVETIRIAIQRSRTAHRYDELEFLKDADKEITELKRQCIIFNREPCFDRGDSIDNAPL
jgi:hypothetical protein